MGSDRSDHMLGLMKFTVVAMVLAVFASGCGRYEGPPDPAFHSTLRISYDGPRDPEQRTLRVVVRDLDPTDVYDQDCRLVGPKGEFAPKLEVVAKNAEFESGVGTAVDLPVEAERVGDGCEAPPVEVTLPYDEEYRAWVSMEGQGSLDPEAPIYPDTFVVPEMGKTTIPTLVLFD